ncbi:hypothetical protein AX17_002595 [Amanita inopinata Kibby_2008]|nr:hypothetical protein AX17_002595 [Amanita inopinata Kibby_2008]
MPNRWKVANGGVSTLKSEQDTAIPAYEDLAKNTYLLEFYLIQEQLQAEGRRADYPSIEEVIQGREASVLTKVRAEAELRGVPVHQCQSIHTPENFMNSDKDRHIEYGADGLTDADAFGEPDPDYSGNNSNRCQDGCVQFDPDLHSRLLNEIENGHHSVWIERYQELRSRKIDFHHQITQQERTKPWKHEIAFSPINESGSPQSKGISFLDLLFRACEEGPKKRAPRILERIGTDYMDILVSAVNNHYRLRIKHRCGCRYMSLSYLGSIIASFYHWVMKTHESYRIITEDEVTHLLTSILRLRLVSLVTDDLNESKWSPVLAVGEIYDE